MCLKFNCMNEIFDIFHYNDYIYNRYLGKLNEVRRLQRLSTHKFFFTVQWKLKIICMTQFPIF